MLTRFPLKLITLSVSTVLSLSLGCAHAETGTSTNDNPAVKEVPLVTNPHTGEEAEEAPKIDVSTLTIIGYHEITSKEAIIPDYAVTPQRFETHLDWLIKNGYHFISVDQLIKANEGKIKLPAKPVLLTVDDGYQSFYDYAYPILKARKIPVVLAVVGKWLNVKPNQMVQFGDDKLARNKLLTWAEIKEMQDSGIVEIGSHSFDLHHGVMGNPQGNSEPAATTRIYDQKNQNL